jgi:beta-lactamase regulating signal transducer with metallopeptidase domain
MIPVATQLPTPIVTSLIASLWQGLAIAALAAILVRAVPRLNAATRHAIWWLAMVIVLLQPWTTAMPAVAVTVAHDAGPVPAGIAADSLRLPTLLRLPAPPEWLLLSGLGLWAALVCFNLWRMAAGVRLIRRLKNGSRVLDQSHQDRLPLWISLRENGRRSELRISDAASSPCALGLGRPVILIPAALAATLPDRDLDLIVAHEHAHLARYDDWLRLLQCALVAVAGLHPAVRVIARQIDLEREAACDDLVVIRAGDPRTYAHCLATVAGLVTRISPLAAAVAPLAVRSGSRLRARVARLMDHRRDGTTGLAHCATMASVATMLLAALVSDRIPPLVVVDNVEPQSARSTQPDGGRTLSGPPEQPIVAFGGPDKVRPATVLQDSVTSRPRSLAIARDAAIRDVGTPGVRGAVETPGSARFDTGAITQRPVVTGAPEPAPPARGDGSVSLLPLASRLLTSAPALPSYGSASEDVDVSGHSDDAAQQAESLVDRSIAAGQQVKRLGQEVGSSSRRAGTSVGRFFSRAGKSIASGF